MEMYIYISRVENISLLVVCGRSVTGRVAGGEFIYDDGRGAEAAEDVH